MEIIYDIFNLKKTLKDAYIAIGTFDGVHLGHKKLIEWAIKEARENNGKSLVFTFSNHPLEIIKKNFSPRNLTTLDEKTELLKKYDIDYLILQPFDQKFADIEATDFLKILKDKLSAKEIFVGFNFTFGKSGIGNIETLKKLTPNFDIKLSELSPVSLNGEVISSTLIRTLVATGKVEDVNKFLGYNFFATGKVIHGEEIARTLGFPTANIDVAFKCLPKFGVYGGLIQIDGEEEKRNCIINIGENPTLKPGILTFEAHLLDYKGDLYDKTVRIELLKFIRSEKKFNSIDELKKAIKNDVILWKEELEHFINDPEEIVLILDNFQGPLDLLLHLINKKKIKISELRISQIIDEYLHIINTAKDGNFDIKVEFLVIAAELLKIKAATLLDMSKETVEEKEFKQKLEDYQIFKELSTQIGKLENEEFISYSRGEGRKIMRKAPKEYNVGELEPLDLFKVYATHLEGRKEETFDLDLYRDYSLNEEAYKLYNHINKKTLSYDDIFSNAENKMHLIYLFLSILELYKDGYIILTTGNVESTNKDWVSLNLDEEFSETDTNIFIEEPVEEKPKKKSKEKNKINLKANKNKNNRK
ncbi:bifunctional riboflavin kinase/FAD synthetase [Fusobacterium sp. PH5-44]|uniref:bifunctional riboflavin kinase/FAD synthetase n=1 Tax=unclassified Fusobacterium TaxID=2648384 RepID=UPI003D21041F